MAIFIKKSKLYVFHRKHRRSYRNILSGIKKAHLQGLQTRFITWTTSPTCIQQQHYNKSTLNRDFVKAIQVIKRLTPNKLLEDGYLSKYQLSYYYKDKDIFDKPIFSELSYFKIHTSEGNGVIHSVFCSPYIPQPFLVDLWSDVHLTFSINVEFVNPEDSKKFSTYVVSQYIANQGEAYLYSSQSKNWLFPGANQYWDDLKYVHLRDNEKWVQQQLILDSIESTSCNNERISDSYKRRINRWMNPPITSEVNPEKFESQYQFIRDKWDDAIQTSIESPTFSYNKKPMVEYQPTPLYCHKCHKHVLTANEPIPLDVMCPHCYEATTLVNEPYGEFPAIFNKKVNLTDADEKRLSVDVLNSLYRESRLNPLVSSDNKRPNVYVPFVETKLSKY
jgi:hypothetical protein